ncbi:hypothetical protein JP28_12115 [Gallibacterium anatis]|nr:hypothetical protein JP28_12115 [Gallibacterium anatis]KGQ47767.1 hypothetical protein IO46_12735 [Gallibacterium anatis]KGQ58660.1 hypothetical protein IO45_08750 [Gallibacterium anatis]
MIDFIKFCANIFFFMVSIFGIIFLLFTVDFIYILIFLSIFFTIFLVRLVMMFIEVDKRYKNLEKQRKETCKIYYY